MPIRFRRALGRYVFFFLKNFLIIDIVIVSPKHSALYVTSQARVNVGHECCTVLGKNSG